MKKVKAVTFLFVLSILLSMFISGCVNPLQEVPVIKIDISFVEKQGIVEAVNYRFTQENVSYFNRPLRVQADSFPAISARVSITKDNATTIGPWEIIPYKGSGNYSLNIGFRDNYRPVRGDPMHISIMVVDKTGQRIGYVIKNIVWQ
jgi:hypothetical protein